MEGIYRFNIKGYIAIISVFMMLANLAFAQSSLVIPVCDSAHFTADSAHVIFYKKNKNGLFDLPTQTVLIKPTKNPILFLSSAQLFVQRTKNGFQVVHYSGGVNQFSYTTNDFCNLMAIFPADVAEKYRNIVLINDLFFNYETGEVIHLDSLFSNDFHPETFFKLDTLDENRLLINYYRSPIEPLLLVDEIYWIDSGFGQSGVFNITSKKWEIPSVYKNCVQKDSLLFCSIETPHFAYADADFQSPFVWYSYAYDIYVIRDGTYVLKSKNLSHLTNENLKELMNWDKAELLADSIHIIAEKNGKKGLWQIELNHFMDEGLSQTLLHFNELLPLEYDFIYFNDEDGLLFTYDERAQQKLAIYNEGVDANGKLQIITILRVNNSIFYGRNDDSPPLLHADGQSIEFNQFLSETVSFKIPVQTVKWIKDESFSTRGCGLSVLNDSLIQILNFKSDSLDKYAAPLQSYSYPNEDSIATRPYGGWANVYPPPIPGYDYTGVFNVSSGNWFIAPEYNGVSYNDGQFLVRSELFHDGSRRTDGAVYSLLSANKEWVFEERTLTDLETDFKAIQSLLVNENQVQLLLPFSKSTGFASMDNNPPRNLFYAQINDGKYEIYDFILDWQKLHIEPICQPKSLIHYNVDLDYFVYLEKDSIYLEWDDTTYCASANQGSIKIITTHETEDRMYSIILSDSLNEQVFTKSPTAVYYAYLHVASFQLIGDRFIINENLTYDNMNEYYFEVDMYWDAMPDKSYRYVETETAVIWEKEDSVWKIISPYYASIEVRPFGYSVRTGAHQKLNVVNGETEDVKEGRWILLDENLKPMAFYDYYDFDGLREYDFGIALSTNSGWFLITTNGNVITSAEWDDFEFEDGRIKAIKYTAESILEYENFGDDPVIEKITYFDFPAN